MPYVLNQVLSSSGAWNIENQTSFRDSGGGVGVLRFPSEGTELWIDEQQEVQCDRLAKQIEVCSHSVPPSPTYGLRLKRVGRVHYCSTPGSMQSEKTLTHRAGRSVGKCRDKLTWVHQQEDHADQCAHVPQCSCSYLSDSQSSHVSTNVNNVSASTSTPTETGQAAPRSRAKCRVGDRTSDTSHCSCSSLSFAQTGKVQRRPSSLDCGRTEDQETIKSQNHLEYSGSGPWESSRRSESLHVERNTHGFFSTTDSPEGVNQQPRENKSTGDSFQNDWPTPIPIKSGLSARVTNNITLDTISVFKYRINYPNLMRWAYHFMRLYSKWRTKGVLVKIPKTSTYDDLSTFVHEVLKKRAEKTQQMFVDDEGRVAFRDSKPSHLESANTADSSTLKNQLWKRRYYALLNAVDFVYKDYQLLHYVSKEGLFDCVSTQPSLPPTSLRPRGRYLPNVWPPLIDDVQNLATVGVDPAGYLAERVTQVLTETTDPGDLKRHKLPGGWPCLFNLSVAFLSDVMAQSRILRNDLDRRTAVHDRLVYVLRQAREQRAKLKLHMIKQRELLDSLSVNLCALQKRLNSQSPAPDLPSSIKDGVVSSISSPFVECEAVEVDRGDPKQRSRSDIKKSISLNQPADPSACRDWSRANYTQRRAEIHAQISSLERVLREEETRRKRLHNRIQELTGNIRVFCRLRPDDTSNGTRDSTGSTDKDVVRKHYLRVSSNDKLLFCTDTLKEQLQERKHTIPFFHQGVRGFISGSNTGVAASATAATGIGGGGGVGYCTSSSWISAGAYTGGSGIGLSSSANISTPKCFIFDRVFGPQATQSEIYQEVDDLIVSCIDGYNVCIMAYGQTGSGKTYTMMGTEAEPGVNRRAVSSLFERCNRRKHWKYSIFVSIVEIYQEDVFDLLEEVDEQTDRSQVLLSGNNPTQTPSSPLTVGTSKKSAIKPGSYKWKRHVQQRQPPAVPWNTWTGRGTLNGGGSHSSGFGCFTGKPIRRRGSVRILSDQLDGVVLQNLHERSIHDETEMLHYLQLAERQRRVGSTRLNICSSRSHLVILLRVTGENQLHMTTSRGTLTLADLAGSENVTKSGSTGERFLEAACINKSLSSLGRVFDALRRQQKPTYRETKLTYLLRPNLGGDSKCLLFVALRTEPEHAEETWRAIHFGQGALQVVPGGNNAGTAGGGGSASAVAVELNQSHSKPLMTVTATSSYTSHEMLMSPATLLQSVRSGTGSGGGGSGNVNAQTAISRGKPKTNSAVVGSNVTNYLPQSFCNMGPAIPKRGWK